MNWENMILDISSQFRYLKNIRQRRRGVIGYFSDYVPEEIIYSGGFHPYKFFSLAGLFDSKPFKIQGPCCSFVKAVSKSNLHRSTVIDGVVFPNICDSLRHLRVLWKSDLTQKFTETINNPTVINDESIRFFRQELERFTKSFESFFNLDITNSKIKQSIRLCNQNRDLLRILSESRQTLKPQTCGSELIGLCILSKILDKEDMKNFLSFFIKERSVDPFNFDGKKRLMLIGPVIDNLEFVRAIEKFDATIVYEDIMNVNGIGFFDLQIDANSEDVFTSLARCYLQNMPSPVLYPSKQRIDSIFTAIKKYNVQGVIFVIMNSCELHSFSYVTLKDLLLEKGIPSICLETEKTTPPYLRELMQIECFLEKI